MTAGTASPAPQPGPRRRVIFLGPPGAGKGTQASLLAKYLRVPRISTGDMLRDAIAAGTELGKAAKPIMERGQLVPDDVLIGIVGERLRQEDCSTGFILDGFPRTVPQAVGFERMIQGDHTSELVVFDVEVPRDELVRRLSGRRWCPVCQSTYHVYNNPPKVDGLCDHDARKLIQRDDDKESVVTNRLEEYANRTAPLIEHYLTRAHFRRIDGYRPVDSVFRELTEIVEGVA